MQLAFKSHRLAVGLFCVSCGLVSAFASCTDSYRSDLPSGSGHPSTSTGAGNGGGGGDIINTDQCSGMVCSNDLQSVIDNCTGQVAQQCNPDEGCYDDGHGPVCMKGACAVAELSKSSYGCDYWALKTAQRPQADGACFAAFVANTWSKAVHLTVDRDGVQLDPKTFTYIPSGQGGNITYTPYDSMKGIDVGQVAILFLSRGPGGLLACPPVGSSPAVSSDTGVVGTGRGKAFHITSDYPVVAYQIAPYGGGMTSYAAATLLIPTSAWDKDYLAIDAYKASEVPNYNGFPSLNILANQPTTVTVTPTADITAGPGVNAAMKGNKTMYSLAKGEFLQITQPAELTGSGISADKPIAVFGAHTCMTVPGMQLDCDSAQQQIAPAHALGNEYVAVRYKNRTGQEESPPWRVVGAVDGTKLTWDPAPPPGAPLTIGVGEVAEFSAAGPFVVTSQDIDHAFYLGGYMTGSQPFMDIGDPEWVNVIPPLQYLTHYVLFTDPTYPETSLVVVRTPSNKDAKVFADVTLDCTGKPLDGWQTIGKYQYTRVDLVTGAFQGVNGCTNGRQEMSSALPFGVTVWGWGTKQTNTSQVSYAYPAGAGFKSINMIPTPSPK